ncbi:mucin-binding protein, partial [Limosilactobacillus caviae]|uniref:mucin-binding protein n=1 Tax=Limosilactobacillus caviae TaxID=1769424 RepID=UPI0035127AA0
MLSHNNWEEQIKKYEPKKQRFTIKKLSVGVASVLLGVTFAAGTASADSTTANADSASGSDSAEQTDHNLTLNSTSTSTLKSATAASQSNSASAAVQNPAGDVKAQAANDYEAAVSAAVANASSDVASDAVQNSSASSVQSSSAADSSAQASAVKSTATQAFSVRSAAVNNFNYASVFASLAAMQQSNNDNAAAQADTNAADSEYSNYKTVTNAYELQNAISDYRISGVNVKGNINPFGDLNINRAFTIHGVDGAVLNLSQNKIVNNGQLTLVDVTVNGSVTGNGTVNIKGTVNSNVNDFNSVTFGSVNELKQQIGSTLSGASVNNWKAANIAASNVNIEQGATLNINRSITGDGIAEPDGGKINVDINASLNVNLKDAQTASRANEQSSSLDNASAGVRILDNGTFTSGDSAKINIHAGHGRAVVINEPFGGTGAVASNTILGEWENGRTGDRSTEAAKHRNTMILGDSTTMNITGRGGIVLGYTATFVTGDHSIIHIDNQGNGEGLLLDANSKVIVSPHSQLLMTSNGKNASGSYDGGNYIGMGQDAKFRVEHDAVFRYRLTNSMNNEKRPYADNFNIISQASNTHPEVYVGNNATFDGQSDYDDYYGEIFAFSLTSGANTSTVFQIDGAKYVNWEKNSQVIRHNGAGNLFYSMDAGLIDATGQKYYVFKWNNKNLNDNNYTFDDSSSESIAQSIANFKNSSDKYWTDIEHLATKYSKSGNTAEWPGHVVSGNDITAGSGYNPVDKKTGTPIGNYNTGDGDDAHTTGFDPLNSQRLVLVASIIPTQEDKTSQEVDNYDVKIVYDENLKPGQVQLVQKGVNGLKRTTTTTYYNVDPSTGEKTLDTSKGINGVSTTTTVLNQKQDEIIHIGKQTATINYLKQTGNSTATPITDENGKAIVGTVTGKPVQTDAQGNVKFDAAGNATANTIDYTNYESDLNNAEENASGYKYSANDDEWAQAVKDGTNKYNVSGLTKEAIQKAAENAGLNTVATITNEGPVFNVVLKKAVKENASLKIVDDTENGKTLNILNATGDENTAISFENGASTVQDYLNKGYKFVSVVSDANGNILSTTNYDAANFGNYDTDPNSDQSFTVHLVHTYAPVNPNNPHEGVNPDQYEKTVNETVHYKYSDGSKAADDNIQTSKWSRTLTLDNVTGKIVPNGEYDKDWSIEPGQPTEYKQVDSPVIKGYYADQANVPATKVTQDDIEKTVTYKPLGHIIPVDPTTDDPIPNAPQPQFPNDPNDPTKGNPGEKPTVPGYHPESGKPGDKVTPNPGNPGEDVKVPYVKDQGTVSVIFHDDTTDSTIPNVGFNSGDAAADTPVTYNPEKSISDLEKQGYVYVRTEGTLPDKVEANKNITVTVHMKHGVQPVTPTTPPTDVPKNTPKEAQPDQLTKKVNLTVNYVNADGTAFTGKVPANAKQTATFTGTAYVDKITGKLVNAKQEDGKWVINTDDTATPEITWTSDKTSFEGVTSPAEENYHVSNVSSHKDGDNVAAITGLTKDSGNIDVTVTYAKNGTTVINGKKVTPTQTVKFVDGEGNELAKAITTTGADFVYSGDTRDEVTGQITKTGSWDSTSHIFGTQDVPVIDGYVAVSGYTNQNGKFVAGGLTATLDDPNVVATVVYQKVGNIVPQLPDGTPVPNPDKPGENVPNKPYTNDPTNPTDVNPKEPVPNIPGYRPEVPTVTPEVPTKDTPVVYNQIQKADLTIVDQDNGNKQIVASGVTTKFAADGINGEAITFTGNEAAVKALENMGYVYVDSDFTSGTKFDGDGATDQHFTITMKHGHQPVNPNEPGKPGQPINPNDPEGPKYPQGSDQVTKNVTRTIQYVDENGNKVSDSVEQPVNFTAEGVLDKVTGQWVTPLTWSGSQTVNGVKSPVVEGYHLVSVDRDGEGNNVKGVTLTHENDSYTVTVKYAKNGKIIPVDPTGKPIPNVPTPQYPTDPTDPSKVTPNEPVPSIPGLTPEVPTVTPTDPGKNTPVKYSQTVNATVNYIDNVTGKTLKTDSLSGLEGVKSDYSTKSSIDGYEAQGYKLVKDGFPKDGYIFEVGGEHTFNVYLTHTTSPVTPDHPGAGYSATDLKKTVTRTINYLDGQGNVVAQQVAQSFDFIANGTVDNVTHKLVTVVDGKITGAGELTWNAANHDFDAVESPAVKGMHVTNVTPADQRDGNNVAKTTVNAQSGNIIVNVYYASNGTHQDGAKNLPSTQTVTFVDEAGNVLHVPSTLDFTFVRTPDVTDPEGNVTEGTWTTGTSHTYKTVNVPVIPGYVTDRTVAGGMTATIDNLDVADKVVYKKVGKIIPVDPTGKPIPGAPTPDYPNDPQNPTKVTPDEPVPSVPGYTPDVPTVTPGVPTVDTPVTYRQNVQATVTYIDDVTNTVLDSDSLSGLDGKKSDYSTAGKIANYESHGYALVSDDFPKDGYTFSVEGTHNFTVHLTHSTSPVNPDHPGAGYNKTDLQKDVTRTIYFVNTQDGKQVAEPVNQTVSFTANGTVDNVTGKLVTVTDGKITGPGELTWTSAQDVKGVQSPAVNGMHVTYVTRDADGTNVKGVSLTHNDSSYDVYVNYAPNGTTNEHGQNIPASQTIKFVDESGNTLRENNVQTSEFVRTPDVVDAFTGKTITEGSWNETSHKFDVIDVPVIEGYVATVKTAGGLTATTDNPNVVTEVVYKKVGKIIPVDPTGKPIPNVPTPEYPNDPTDPTKVTPNEPVPTIPGYTPETPTVTPEVPTKDTPVKYTPVDNTQNAQVRYIDLTNNEEIANSGNLSGQPGDKINYSTADTIKSLTDKGYVLVNDGFPADAAFDNDKGHDQVFTVTFRHGTQPVNPNEPGKPGQPINPNDPEGPKYPQGSDQVTK